MIGQFIPWILFVIIITEYALKYFWVRPYYKYGLPLYSKKIELKKEITAEAFHELMAELRGVVNTDRYRQRFLFERVSNSLILFREEIVLIWIYGLSGKILYTPFMKGFLEYDREKGVLKLVGTATLNSLIAIIGLITVPIIVIVLILKIGTREAKVMLILVPIILAAIYGIAYGIFYVQKKRYNMMYEYLKRKAIVEGIETRDTGESRAP